ncbi:hypothetical protein K458DRAFT_476909 [Lentithecium fluviatile CBS 122367]|uniref:NHL repeat-containing protein n=1 Tax=Lentithecium fluviatile CBS 122367 TaxID=1168545 RepID=A0A6G1J5V9_9PLEO|nr:hypothetical protein K458DRAFT_476909 [Lentithecium fluviatile CBS 122367]
MRSFNFSLTSLVLVSSFFTPSYQTPTPHSVKKIYQFPFQTWVENIAVRSNGQLLVTLLNAPELHLIDPSTSPLTSKLIHSFVDVRATSLLGIAELSHDVFAVVVDQMPQTPGNCSIWKADFKSDPAAVSKIADVQSTQLLNGIAKLNDHTLLVADSMAGNIVKLDVTTGASTPILEDASTKPGTINGGFAKSGVNGIKILGSHVYYTNSALASFHRVRIDCSTGEATGPFETLATSMPDADDFALLKDGTAFVAVGSGHVVEKVAGGRQSVFAGDLHSSAVPGPTAAALGRGSDEDVLYVVTNGGAINPVNGTFAEGGSVLAVELR